MSKINANRLIIFGMVLNISAIAYEILIEKNPLNTMKIISLVISIITIISTRFYK